MKIGTRVKHETFGLGTVISIEHGKKLGDGGWPRLRQSSIVRISNGDSRYEGIQNLGVKFDTGGPQGWAKDANHNIKELETV